MYFYPRKLISKGLTILLISITSVSYAQEESIPSDDSAAKPEVVESSSSQKTTRTTHNLPQRTWSMGFGANLVHPLTDYRSRDFFGLTNPVFNSQYGAQFRVTKMFDGAFGLMFNAQYNRMQGAFDTMIDSRDQIEYMNRAGVTEGIYYRSNVIQGSVNLYWNITNTVFNINKQYKADNEGRYVKERRFSLYTYTGFGMSVFDPHVMFLENSAPASFPNVDFKVDRTTSIVIPLAFGTKFKLSKAIDMSIEYSLHFLLNDRLDGLEYDHPTRRKNDTYTTLGVAFDFKLGGKKKDKEHLEWTNCVECVYYELNKIKRTVNQLTKDSDGDGVSDYFDKEPDTPEGVMVDGSGRAMDIDGDGVPDYMDLERFTEPGAIVDQFGIALDSDGDGVPDHRDLEPNTPQGHLVNFQGVSIENRIKTGDIRGVHFPSIYFDTDQILIKRQYEEDLFIVARDMQRLDGAKFILEGHCDERGSEEYNYDLALRRAEAVKQYLVDNYKIDPDRIKTASKGSIENQSPRFHINRRVDIFLFD
jgi:outer membrane protein OmpA-like peptidoglycan-associated protein